MELRNFVYHRQKNSVNSHHSIASYRAGEQYFRHKYGLCSYKEYKNYIFLCGEPIVYDCLDRFSVIAKRLVVLQDFYRFCQNKRKKLLGYYLDYPFSYNELNSYQIGLQAFQTLENSSFTSKQLSYYKRIRNYGEKHSYQFYEIDDKQAAYDLVNDLRKKWIYHKAKPEIKNLLAAPGSIKTMGFERWFGVNQKDQLIGFVNLLPYQDPETSYYIDNLFYLNDGKHKMVLDFLLFHLNFQLKEEGVKNLHYGLCPFVIPLPNGVLENLFSRFAHFNFIYSFKGLFKFKRKFCDSYKKAYILWNKEINLVYQFYLLVRFSLK